VWEHLQYLFKGGTILRKWEVDKFHLSYAVSGFTNPKCGLPIIYGYFDARKLIGIKRFAFPILKELVADAAAGKHRTPAGAQAMAKRCTEVNPVYRGWKAAKDRMLALNAEPFEDIVVGNSPNGVLNSAPCALEALGQPTNALNGELNEAPLQGASVEGTASPTLLIAGQPNRARRSYFSTHI
jgi:hypothetical protein